MSIYVSRVRAAIAAAVVVLVFIAGYVIAPKSDISVPVITQPAPHVTTIEVPVPVITEKIVTKYVPVPDRAAAHALLTENERLKVRVEQLSVSLANAQSRGQGTAVIAPAPAREDAPTPAPTRVSFTDWRLNFTADGTDVQYTLTQKFSILNTIGHNKKGVATNLVELYEIGPNDTRTKIPTTETTTIAAVSPARWHVAPALQAGVGRITSTSLITTRTVVAGVSRTQRATNFTTSAIVAVQWLTHGQDTSLRHTRWAVASPAVSLSSGDRAVGVLPVSFNIGSISRQPFSNLWVSPFVGTTGTAILDRVGLIGSATF